jgi:hypothetical protein
MEQGLPRIGRFVGAFAALVLLTQCGGGGETEEPAIREARPVSPAILLQEVVTTRTFAASADARVEAAYPTRNFGGESWLSADLSPQQESYLRFTVSGVTGAVTRATLRLYATDGTSDGPRVFSTSSGWTEAGLTWNNRPAPIGGVLDDKGTLPSGGWVDFDVTGAVYGDGDYAFALVGTSGNGADFVSREGSRTDLRPQLVLTVESAPDCMPATDRWSYDINPILDGYASLSAPTSRFGSAPVLLVDGSPRLESFLQFGFSIPDEWHVRESRLRLHATDSTSNGPLLYRASNDWPAQDFDWNTRPALFGGPVGNLGPISAGTWAEYDVTAVVPGSGLYSFGLVPESSNGVDFVSNDAATTELRPHLRLTLESNPFCTYRGTGGGLTGWTRHYGGEGPEVLHALATDATGGFVAAGHFGEAPFPTGTGFALARYTSDGTPVWTRQVTTGDVRVSAITVTPLGNILVVGGYSGSPDLGTGPLPTTPPGGFAHNAFFIAKFSPTGETDWAHGFLATFDRPDGGPLEHWPVTPTAVATDAAGSLIVVGGFHGEIDLGGGPLFAGLYSIFEDEPFPGGFVAKFSWEGRHLWSKAFEAGSLALPALLRAVSTDSADNVLVGGVVNSRADLGDGPVGEFAPFIAKYDASGALLWKRLFSGASGEVAGVQPLGTSGVAFSANFGMSFTFGGVTYTGGDPENPFPWDSFSGFTGTLSATGEDGWIRPLGLVTVQGLVTGGGDTLTVPGYGYGSTFDLGGGVLGGGPFARPFVARYVASGEHLWSRAFDRNLGQGTFGGPTVHLAPQPGGSVVVGSDFREPIRLDGRTYTPRGASDLLYFQLKP